MKFLRTQKIRLRKTLRLETTMMSSACSNDTFSSSYPRTGKRGVPQQFPRRLSEMLESEARLASIDPGHQNIISWSASGKAFRIENVSLFSSRILPKYFRTSKFSSFQRNLNLVSMLFGRLASTSILIRLSLFRSFSLT